MYVMDVMDMMDMMKGRRRGNIKNVLLPSVRVKM